MEKGESKIIQKKNEPDQSSLMQKKNEIEQKPIKVVTLESILIELYLEPKDKTHTIFTFDEFKTAYPGRYQITFQRFDSIHSYFLKIIESFNKEKEDQNTNLSSLSYTKINNSNNNTHFLAAQAFIAEFWFDDHPFHIILNLLYARIYIKTRKIIPTYEEKIEKFYLDALKITKKCLGINNIFFANLCEEIGRYYVTVKKIYEAVQHFKLGHKVYKEYKEEFFECFLFNLKKITKYLIIMGHFEEAFIFGYNQLFINYNYLIKKDKDIQLSTQNGKKFNFYFIIINLIYLVKTLGYDYYAKVKLIN